MDFVYEQCGNCGRKGVYLVPERELARCKYCRASEACRSLHPSNLPAVAAGLHAAEVESRTRGGSRAGGSSRPGDLSMDGGVLSMDMATISVLATRGSTRRSSRRSTGTAASAPERAEPGQPTAMVVDDDPTVRAVMVASLERGGLLVTEAGSGRVACASVLADPPDLVVLDLGMPGMDGLEVLMELKNRCDVGIMVVSGRSSEGDRVVALELGADDYLAKPFSPGELLARARAVIARRGRRPGASMASG